MAVQTPQELAYETALVDAKAAHDARLEQYKAVEAIHLVSFKATLDFGALASKGMLLLNGASAIALLAFLGSGRATDWHTGKLAIALGTFATGAFLAVLGMGVTYLGQCFFTLATRRRREHSVAGYSLQGLAMVIWVVSAAMFFVGLWRGATVFSPELQWRAVLGF
ncbi:MAG: hypothetical protein LCH95_01920 [Proteobacteria bacterium]|nr:hypothetical protein [Pseudomonadota bacterium]